MGNKTSTLTSHNESGVDTIPENLPLEDKLDFLATHYILTMDFNSLRKLYEKSYCEKLVLLTSNIIDKHFGHLDVDKVSERVNEGTITKEKITEGGGGPDDEYDSRYRYGDLDLGDDPGLYRRGIPDYNIRGLYADSRYGEPTRYRQSLYNNPYDYVEADDPRYSERYPWVYSDDERQYPLYQADPLYKRDFERQQIAPVIEQKPEFTQVAIDPMSMQRQLNPNQPLEQLQTQPFGQVQPLGEFQAQPLGQVQVQPLGQVQVQPLGQVQVQPLEQVQVQPLEQVQPNMQNRPTQFVPYIEKEKELKEKEKNKDQKDKDKEPKEQKEREREKENEKGNEKEKEKEKEFAENPQPFKPESAQLVDNPETRSSNYSESEYHSEPTNERDEEFEVDKPSSESPSKERVYYTSKEDFDRLNMPAGEQRTAICNEIAKFYIKIAHLFAAIVTTISPEYEYTDYLGNKVRKSFFEKSSIPRSAVVKVTKLNLCNKHIDKLKGNTDIDSKRERKSSTLSGEAEYTSSSIEDEIVVNPKLCKFSKENDSDSDSDSESGETLGNQPGIAQLEELYNNDDYDFKTGKFKGRSSEMQEQYQRDLERFYRSFSDEDTIPPGLHSFSDIKVKDHKKGEICKKIREAEKQKEELQFQKTQQQKQKIQEMESQLKKLKSDGHIPEYQQLKVVLEKEKEKEKEREKEREREIEKKKEKESMASQDKKASAIPLGEYRGSYRDELFVKYAENIRKMVSFVNEQQEILLRIIDSLFVVYKDPINGKKYFRVNPEISMEDLNRLIAKAREVIVNLYLTCQNDYDEGIDIYKAIVESLSVQLVEKQISALENKKEDLTYLHGQEEMRMKQMEGNQMEGNQMEGNQLEGNQMKGNQLEGNQMKRQELRDPQFEKAKLPNDIRYQQDIVNQKQPTEVF